ncbi:SURF1 family cytochrome oxidase biogenesis protein [Streptacidiphilus monticola]
MKGARGYYVLTPLRTASGVYVPVVRGWAPGRAPATAPAAPGGTVTVTARLELPETQDSAQAITTGSLPRGQLGMISATTLVNALPYQVWNGWLAADPAADGLRPVVLTASADSSGGGLNLRAAQNLGYIGEWFVFAGFVVFMWFRLFRREVEQARDAELGLG